MTTRHLFLLVVLVLPLGAALLAIGAAADAPGLELAGAALVGGVLAGRFAYTYWDDRPMLVLSAASMAVIAVGFVVALL